jgi:WD40 repeat protein
VDPENVKPKEFFPKIPNEVVNDLELGLWSDRLDAYSISNELIIRSEESAIHDHDIFGWSPNGEYIAVGHTINPSVYVIGVVDDQQIMKDVVATYPGGVEQIIWSRCGNYLVTCSNVVEDRSIIWRCIWETTKNRRLLRSIEKDWDANSMGDASKFRNLLRNISPTMRGRFRKFCFSPNSKYLVTVGSEQTIKQSFVVLSTDGYKCCSYITVVKHSLALGFVSSVSVSNDDEEIFYCVDRQLFCIQGFTNQTNLRVLRTGFSADLCKCNPVAGYIAIVGYNIGSDKTFIRSTISIRKTKDFSLVTEYSIDGEIVDVEWSSDGGSVWAVTEREIVVRASDN